MLRGAVTAITLLPLAALAAFEAYVWTHRGDAPPVDDSELASLWRPVPDETNGRVALLAALPDIELPDEAVRQLQTLRSMDTWDLESARPVLERNAPLFGAIDSALSAPHFQRPRLAAPPATAQDAQAEAEEMSRGIAVSLLCGMRAIQTAWETGSAIAIDEALRCFRLGQRVASMPGAGIELLEARTHQSQGGAALRLSLARISVSAAESRRREAELEELRIGVDAWHGFWAEQYRQASDILSLGDDDRALFRRWLVPLDYSIQVQRSRLRLAEAAREMRAFSGRPCAQPPQLELATTLSRPEWLPAWENERWVRLWIELELERQGLRPNAYGDWLVDLTLAGWEKLADHRCGSENAVSAAQALIALRAYQVARGELPPALDALVPAYLSRVPADAYDGAPLRYSRERKLLWSIGSDLRDAGGAAPSKASAASAEPSWKISW